ncbi:hypothetical protein HS125_02265 [bacterium]|nr:hypothetical protein [bacterium]
MRARTALFILWLAACVEPADAQRLRYVLEAEIPVAASPDVEVVAGSVRVEPPTPASFKTAFFSAVVRNVGGCPLPKVYLRALSGPADGPLGRVGNLAAWDTPQVDDLPVGGTAEVVIRWDSPERTGPHSVVVEADPDNLLGEADRSNNAATAQFTVLGPPDLVLAGIRAPAGVTHEYRAPVQLLFDVENRGESPSREVFLEMETAGSTLARTIPPLAPGERKTLPLAAPAARALTVSARVDRYNIEPEPDENNNAATAELTLAVVRRIASDHEERWSTRSDWGSGTWSGASWTDDGLALHPALSVPAASWALQPAGAVNRASPARDAGTLFDDLWTLDDFLRAGPREHPPVLTLRVRDASLIGRYRVYLRVLVHPHLNRYTAGGFRFAGPGAPGLVEIAPRFHSDGEEYRDVPLGIYPLAGEFRCKLGAVPGQFLLASRLLFRPLVEYEDLPTEAPPGTRLTAVLPSGAQGVTLYVATEGRWQPLVASGAPAGPLRVRLPGDWTSERPLPPILWRWIPPREGAIIADR